DERLSEIPLSNLLYLWLYQRSWRLNVRSALQQQHAPRLYHVLSLACRWTSLDESEIADTISPPVRHQTDWNTGFGSGAHPRPAAGDRADARDRADSRPESAARAVAEEPQLPRQAL